MAESKKQIILGGSEDFHSFLETQSKLDRNTLRIYWKLACRKHSLLVIRHVGPRMGHVLVMPVDRLPKVEQYLKTRSYYIGIVFARLQKGTCLIFGEGVKPEVKAEVKPEETKASTMFDVKPKRKMGRPRGSKNKVSAPL